MTKKLSKSSKFFSKKYKIDPIIKHEPSGILFWYLCLKIIKIKDPKMAAKKRIRLSENGPNNDPMAPNNIKSPPPIPSILYSSLKIKFINHKEKYPITKP